MGRVGIVVGLASGVALLGAMSPGDVGTMPQPVSLAMIGTALFCLSTFRIKR